MKRILSLCAAFALSCALFAFTDRSVRTFVFENGLTMFLLEDGSCATVTADLCVDAGFSRQTERDAGFFELYAELVGGEISSDYVRLRTTRAPLESEEAFQFVSSLLRPPSFSDAQLSRALGEARKRVSAQADDVAGFLNAAIDARVFPEAPWKTANGASPPFFSSFTVPEARAVLGAISRRYYVPSNAFLFLSGNISAQTAQALAMKYFGEPSELLPEDGDGSMRAREEIARRVASGALGAERKFVLHDPAFSSDMTQIVVQFTGFSMDEADVLSAVLDQDSGPYKRSVLSEERLGIRGAEYINVASAQRRGSSRLVFQSLFEGAELGPVEQADIFLEKIRGIDFVTEGDVGRAARGIAAELERTGGSPQDFMELLARWHALTRADFPAQSLFARGDDLARVDAADVQERLSSLEPFVFLLVSSQNYRAHEKRFAEGGFVPLTRKNGPWYTQDVYKELLRKNRSSASRTVEELSDEDIRDAARRFVLESRNALSSFPLSNGIPVVVKSVPSARTVALALTIRGGDMLFSRTPGLASVLTDCLAVNVRNALDIMAADGSLEGGYDVTARTNALSSFLNVSCSARETERVLRLLSEVIIYSDISPALADGVTFDERMQWRIKTGSAEFQLLCEAMRQLYGGSDYLSLFREDEDKPVTMEFVDIAEAYPVILDASRYSIVVTGGVRDAGALKRALEETFGTLGTHAANADDGRGLDAPQFPAGGVAKRIQLKHLFLTDVPADKAGPQPAVLIPTTRFLDPVLYCLGAPSATSGKAGLFDALLFEIAERMERKIGDKNTKVNALPSDTDYLFARLVATNVLGTAGVDAAYAAAAKELRAELSALSDAEGSGAEEAGKSGLLSAIESRWVLRVLSGTGGPDGDAALIQTGAARGNPGLYVDEYERLSCAGAGDYLSVLDECFPPLPPVRIYSRDSK